MQFTAHLDCHSFIPGSTKPKTQHLPFLPARQFQQVKKMLLIMRLTVILVLAACLEASAGGYAQQITLRAKDMPCESVFREITRQSGYQFFFNKKLIRNARNVSVELNAVPVEKAIQICFADQPFDFAIVNKTVVIRKKEQPAAVIPEADAIPPVTIKGKITDEKGNVLAGASVKVKSSGKTTQAGEDGVFSIEANTGDRLEISFVGFESREIIVGEDTNIKIVLKPADVGLNEIAVVGYGTQKRRDVIGSISTIKSDVFEKSSIATNFSSLLQGQAAGVSVQTQSGRPGAAVDIKIRGLSSISASTGPLWIVDGVPIVTGTGIDNNGSAEQSPMSLINPNDILSVDILKDAAATAVYGSRGSNGVIIVTTKSGKVGKASFNFSYNTGVSDLPFQKVKFVTDSKAWFKLKDEAKAAGGLGAFDMTDYYSKQIYATEFLTREQAENINNDWIKIGTRKGHFQSAGLSTSGGNNNVRYYISGLYRKDYSIMPNEDLERYGVRANLDVKPLKSLDVGVKVDVSVSKGNRGKNTSGGTENGNKEGTAGGFFFLNSRMLPSMPVYSLADPTQYYNPYVMNPIATSDPKNLVEALDMYRFLVTAYGEYSIPYVKGLSLRTELSEDFIQANRNFWVSSAIRFDGSFGQDGSTTNKNINYNLYLKFNRGFGDHSLDIAAGTESQKGKSWSRSMQGRDLVGTYQQLGTPSLIDRVFSGLTNENMLRSYFGRANYKYKERYMAGLSVRSDGASVFTPEYRWGSFVALSAGWILSDENFLSTLAPNVFLKLRGSYGQTGNASIPQKLDVTNYTSTNGYGSSDILGTDGTIVSSIGVKNLVWEKTNNLDLGIDFGFLNHRIDGSVAYYHKYVRDLLLQSALPPSAGIGSIWGNIGDLVNSGIELSVTSRNLPLSKRFGWTTTLNAAYNHNEVKRLTPQVDAAGTGMLTSPYITKVGYGIREYFLAEFAGVDPQTGLGMIYARDQEYYEKTGETRRLTDASGKEVLLVDNNANMNTNLFHLKGKSAMPKYYGGITNAFSFKGFDLSILITFSGGNYILDDVWRDFINPGQSQGPLLASYMDNYWKKPGDKAKYQRLDWLHNILMEDGSIVGVGDPRVPMDQSLFKGDFVKLKNISLGYTFSSSPGLQKVFQSFKVYCSLDNIYTITKYPGWDPEGQGYVTAWDLPQLFSASAGINIRF